MKFVANHLVAIHNVASAEAMLLAERAGLDACAHARACLHSRPLARLLRGEGDGGEGERGESLSVSGSDERRASLASALRNVSTSRCRAAIHTSVDA